MRTLMHKSIPFAARPSASTTVSLTVSWIMMIPLLFFAAHGTFSFLTTGRSSLAGGQDLAGLVPNRQFGFLGFVAIPALAYSIVSWAILSNLPAIVSVARKAVMLTLLALITILSAAWSQDALRSTYNGGFYLVGTLFAFFLIVRFSSAEIMTLIKMTGVIVCAACFLTIVAMPQVGISNAELRTAGAWNGIFLDRTTAAKCLVFLLSPALVFGHGRFGYRRIAYIALLGLFIVKAHAFTALLVIAFYTLFMLFIGFFRRMDGKTAALAAMLFFSLCSVTIFIVLPQLGSILEFFGRDLTLTGRTEVWDVVLQSIYKRPLLGYGFYAFWLGMRGESANAILQMHWFVGYAHNGMLDILLQLGIAGLITFFVVFLRAVKDAAICLRHKGSAGTDWYVGLIFLTTLYNIDEATVVWPNDLLSILFVVACSGLLIEAKRLKFSDALPRSVPSPVAVRMIPA